MLCSNKNFKYVEKIYKLSQAQEEKLLGVLKECKNAVGWTIGDLKCINLSVYEDGVKLVRDA